MILDAATRVSTKESLSGFNTNRIAEVAGVSVGSVYQYFPNKAALVTTLIERTQAALADAIEQCAALDCLVIVKALVEAEASRPVSNLEALRERIVRALQGYLRNPVTAA